MAWQIRLENEGATVEIAGTTYKDGDTFTLPANWRYDAEFSAFVKRPSFAYETYRTVRDVTTGRRVQEADTKRVTLPVIEVEEGE